MTIYGKNLYATGKCKKSKSRKFTESGITGKQIVEDAFSREYGKAKKVKCQKCGAFIFLIKGKAHDLAPDGAGCHEPHRCR